MLPLKKYIVKIIRFKHKNINELYFNNMIHPYKYINVQYRNLWKVILKRKGNATIRTYKIIYKFLETTRNKTIGTLTPHQRYIFFFYYLFLYQKNYLRSREELYRINHLYGLYCYKGWRHLFGRPVNGQRTWSNGKTRKKQKNKIYNHLLFQFQKKYGIHTKTNLKLSFMSEHLNLLWSREWQEEWLSANNIFKESKQKKKYFRLRINYRYIMNFQISTPKSIEYRKTKKNRKKVKTEFTVGFDTLYVVSLFSKKKHVFKHLL